MSEQSKVLELAEVLESGNEHEKLFFSKESAKELRRLDAENAALRAQLAQGEPVGWKLVPEIPDTHMREALASPEATELEWWEKILSVSPPAPQQAPVDEREAFEAWAVKNNKFHTSGYNPSSDLFEAWQARAAIKPAVSQDDIEKYNQAFQYIKGIGERVLNQSMQDGETLEGFILSAVQHLENQVTLLSALADKPAVPQDWKQLLKDAAYAINFQPSCQSLSSHVDQCACNRCVSERIEAMLAAAKESTK